MIIDLKKRKKTKFRTCTNNSFYYHCLRLMQITPTMERGKPQSPIKEKRKWHAQIKERRKWYAQIKEMRKKLIKEMGKKM